MGLTLDMSVNGGRRSRGRNRRPGRGRRRFGRGGDALASFGPSVSSTRFIGNIDTFDRQRDLQLITAVIVGTTTVTINTGQTDASGQISSDCHSTGEFPTYYSNIYDAYRVLAMDVLVQPALSGGAGASMVLPCGLGFACDYDDAGAGATTMSALSQYDSFKIVTIGNFTTPQLPTYKRWRANGADLMQWGTTTAAPTKVGSIRWVAETSTSPGSNSNVCKLITRYLVQFRGRY